MEQLSTEQVNGFNNNSFVKVENAFSTELANQCRAILWESTGCDPNDPTTWIRSVIRIGELGLEPFKEAANTEILYRVFDQLAGKGNLLSRATLGTFVIRFPSKE